MNVEDKNLLNWAWTSNGRGYIASVCTICNLQFNCFTSCKYWRQWKLLYPSPSKSFSEAMTCAWKYEMNNVASHAHNPNVEQAIGIGAHTCEILARQFIFITKEVCRLVWPPWAHGIGNSNLNMREIPKWRQTWIKQLNYVCTNHYKHGWEGIIKLSGNVQRCIFWPTFYFSCHMEFKVCIHVGTIVLDTWSFGYKSRRCESIKAVFSQPNGECFLG